MDQQEKITSLIIRNSWVGNCLVVLLILGTSLNSCAQEPTDTIVKHKNQTDMNVTESKIGNEIVADLVTENYKTAEVFKKYGIDFCCGGQISIGEACAKAGVDISRLEDDLAAVNQKNKNGDKDFNEMPLDELIDHIVDTHHTYVAENIPLLLEFTQKIAEVHGETNPELGRISELFYGLAGELQQHMMKKEQILFPYIKCMVNPEEYPSDGGCGHFGSVQNPINMMEHEHDSAGNALRELRKLSDNYALPSHACNTYRVTFEKLQEFEDDLHRHIHLENNILFPKAIAMESR